MKKFLFVVQGEGRGHMTQSIALKNMLEGVGAEVCEVIIGKSPHREIPSFYKEKMNCPITTIDSPNFSYSNMKSVLIIPTILKSIANISLFTKSLKTIDQKIAEHKPDLIINFYEPLMGLYSLFYKPKASVISIAHQYLFNHSEFLFPKSGFFDKLTLRLYTKLTSFGSIRKLALSFYDFEDDYNNNIFVVPPLLRDEVYNKSTTKNDYILAYVVNSGYLEDIISWQQKNDHVQIHCFSDRKSDKDIEQVNENLFLHKLNDAKFLSMMAGAKGLVTTAGFESVCEAMYLGKPVFMVPIEGQYEQFLNSRDAYKVGNCIYDKNFDISRFLDYLSTYRSTNNNFKYWADESKKKILSHLNMLFY